MKTLRRVCAFLLVLASLFSITGCVNHNWSVKSGDDEIAAGIYIYYMMTAYNDATAKYKELNKDMSEEELNKVDILTATIDGKVGREWILEEARNYCERHFAVDALCEERSIKLSDEDVSAINNTLNYMVSYYGTFFQEAGISTESVRKVYENSYLYSDLLYSYYDTKGEYALEEDAIKKHFSETYFAYKVIEAPFVYTSNGKEVKYSDDEIKARQNIINQLYTEGTQSDTVTIDQLNKKFVNRNLKEGEKETEPAKLTLLFATEDTTTNYGEEFFETLKKAKDGDYLKFETKDKGIYLVQKLDEYSDDSKKYKDTREACIAEMVEDEYKELLNKKADSMEFVYNEKAIAKYDLNNLIKLLNS